MPRSAPAACKLIQRYIIFIPTTQSASSRAWGEKSGMAPTTISFKGLATHSFRTLDCLSEKRVMRIKAIRAKRSSKERPSCKDTRRLSISRGATTCFELAVTGSLLEIKGLHIFITERFHSQHGD